MRSLKGSYFYFLLFSYRPDLIQIEDQNSVFIHLGGKKGECLVGADRVIPAKVGGIEHSPAAAFPLLSFQTERVTPVQRSADHADRASPPVIHQLDRVGLAHRLDSVTVQKQIAAPVYRHMYPLSVRFHRPLRKIFPVPFHRLRLVPAVSDRW